MQYVARKLTRHYYTELAEFLAEFAPKQIESYQEPIDHALKEFRTHSTFPGAARHPTWANGDYFFAAVVSPDGPISASDIVLGAFVDYSPQSPCAGRPAAVVHVAVNEERLADSPGLLNGFFRLLQRSARARNCTELYITTALDSALLPYLARHSYQIISHEFKRDDNILRAKFRLDLVPTYMGDTLQWDPLCRWYLDISFGSFASPLRACMGEATGTHSLSLEITSVCRPPGTEAPPLQPLAHRLHKVPINAVVVPTPDLVTPAMLAAQIEPFLLRDRYNIALLNVRRKNSTETRQFSQQCELVYRDQIEELLKEAKGLYYEKRSAGREAEWWDRWLHIKLGFDEADRHAIIVEIDRDSYMALLKKLQSTPRPERILFLNDGGFGEALHSGARIMFYVWDAVAEVRDREVTGVIAAYGRIQEIKSWSLPELRQAWPELCELTLWKEFFAEQYFSDRVVGFYIDQLEAVGEETDACIPLPGVSYDVLLDKIFPLSSSGVPLARFREELLPSWDVKNAYLSERLWESLSEELRKTAGVALRRLISPLTLLHLKPTNETRGAAYWMANPPRPCKERVDVFFSFSANDESGPDGGWKSYIMNSISGSLEAVGFQKPYVFDEVANRRSLGQGWVEALVARMRCARAALILWSPNYLDSATCRMLELPYLLLRRHNDGLKIFWLRLADTATKTLSWNDVDLGPEGFDVSREDDDRKAYNCSTSLPKELRDATMQALRSMKRPDILSDRMQNTVMEIIEHLKSLGPAK